MADAVLKILTAGATREGLALCAAPFEQRTGIRIDADTTHGHLIERQVRADESDHDIVLLPSAMIENLIGLGLALEESCVSLGRISVGAAVRDGVTPPDVSTMDGLERTLAGAGSIVLTLAPSGWHMERVIASLGLEEQVAGRIIRCDTGAMVNDHLVASEAVGEVAFGVATEILFRRDSGVTYAGPIPDEVQMALDYDAVMLARSRKHAEAGALLAFLATRAGRVAFAKTGVENHRLSSNKRNP
jgi:molybdate transport system substrate-binding protein